MDILYLAVGGERARAANDEIHAAAAAGHRVRVLAGRDVAARLTAPPTVTVAPPDGFAARHWAWRATDRALLAPARLLMLRLAPRLPGADRAAWRRRYDRRIAGPARRAVTAAYRRVRGDDVDHVARAAGACDVAVACDTASVVLAAEAVARRAAAGQPVPRVAYSVDHVLTP